MQKTNCSTGCPVVTVDPVYPGTALRVGSTGSEVARMQKYLNVFLAGCGGGSALTVDGNFGSRTKSAVEAFQTAHGLIADGVIGSDTWNAVVCAYNGVCSGSAETYPGITLRPGMTGQDVLLMQQYLNELSATYPGISMQAADGAYGNAMSNAARQFQYQFSLSADGLIGTNTWARIVSVHTAAASANPSFVTTVYPGTALRVGSSGDHVRFAQSYLNGVLGTQLTVDGMFGAATQESVRAFQQMQGLSVDGVIGGATWAALIPAFNATLRGML